MKSLAPPGEAFDRRPDVAHPRQDEHHRVGIHGPRALEELEPVHDRHLDVRHRERRRRLLEDVEGLATIAGEEALIPLRGEDVAQHLADVPVVVDDQHRTRVHAGAHAAGTPRIPEDSAPDSPYTATPFFPARLVASSAAAAT